MKGQSLSRIYQSKYCVAWLMLHAGMTQAQVTYKIYFLYTMYVLTEIFRSFIWQVYGVVGLKSVWLEIHSLFYFRMCLQGMISISHLAQHWASLCFLDVPMRITHRIVTIRQKIWVESCDVSILGMRLEEVSSLSLRHQKKGGLPLLWWKFKGEYRKIGCLLQVLWARHYRGFLPLIYGFFLSFLYSSDGSLSTYILNDAIRSK